MKCSSTWPPGTSETQLDSPMTAGQNFTIGSDPLTVEPRAIMRTERIRLDELSRSNTRYDKISYDFYAILTDILKFIAGKVIPCSLCDTMNVRGLLR